MASAARQGLSILSVLSTEWPDVTLQRHWTELTLKRKTLPVPRKTTGPSSLQDPITSLPRARCTSGELAESFWVPSS
ncbi:hypothetical protein MHYP_G00311490 [Metynnis hypsauchen]